MSDKSREKKKTEIKAQTERERNKKGRSYEHEKNTIK